MSKVKLMILFAAFLAAAPQKTVLAEEKARGGKEASGGDLVEVQFMGIGRDVLRTILNRDLTRMLKIDARKLGEAIETTQIKVTTSPILVGGIEKTARNFPAARVIEVNFARWNGFHDGEQSKQSLVLHEYLMVSGHPDAAYQISSKFFAALNAHIPSGWDASSYLQSRVEICDLAGVREALAAGGDPTPALVTAAMRAPCVMVNDSVTIFNLLLDGEADSLAKDPSSGKSVFQMAFESPKQEGVGPLVEHRPELAHVPVKDSWYGEISPLRYAVRTRTEAWLPSVRILAARATPEELRSAWFFMCEDIHNEFTDLHAEKTVPELLAAGAEIDDQDDSGNTALIHCAARNNVNRVLRELLDRGAKLDITNARGQSAMDVAVSTCSPESLLVLFDRGARVSHPSFFSFLGCRRDVLDLDRYLETLLKLGADPSERNANGETPLIAAIGVRSFSWNELAPLVRVTSRAYGALNAKRTGDGRTALAVLADRAANPEGKGLVRGWAYLAWTMIGAGADPKIRDSAGEVPEEIYRRKAQIPAAFLVRDPFIRALRGRDWR